jgi:hypothetical protein
LNAILRRRRLRVTSVRSKPPSDRDTESASQTTSQRIGAAEPGLSSRRTQHRAPLALKSASIEEPELIEPILAHRRERGEEAAPRASLHASSDVKQQRTGFT